MIDAAVARIGAYFNTSSMHILRLGGFKNNSHGVQGGFKTPYKEIEEKHDILGHMTPVESGEKAIRDQLARILASPGFSRNERLSRFLQFVVGRRMEGRDHELKETVIAMEVFGRPPDYNPKQDAIVRTEAGRLRARLAEYYLGEGSSDALVIELPRGGYIPAFRQAGSTEADRPDRKRLRLGLAAAIAGVAILVAITVWWWTQSRNAPITIAVLPFENLNHDPAYDYLADGLTDELISNLSTFDGLAPRSRTSSFALRGKPRNIREAGKELAADYVVEGSILRSGQKLRINARLVRARDDFKIWSGEFDREVSDTLAIQDEISRAIVNNLRVKLGRGQRRYETSPEAYDLYLRARASDFRQSIGPFEEAIAKDPSFAPAYAGLAATYAYRTSTVYFDRKDELTKMRAAAEKAIELDPLLAEAQDARAMAYARDGRWDLAEKSFRRAVELEPSRSETYGDFAMYLLLTLGRSRARPSIGCVFAQKVDHSPDYSECTSLGCSFPRTVTMKPHANVTSLRNPTRVNVSAGRVWAKGESGKPWIFLEPKSPVGYCLAHPSAVIWPTGMPESAVAPRQRKSLTQIGPTRFIKFWLS